MTWLRVILAVALISAIVACTSASPTPRPTRTPTSTPEDDLPAITRLVAKQYSARLLAGDTTGSSLLSWSLVQGGGLVPQTEVDRFCRSIDVQGLDGAIAKLLFAGLQAVAKPLRRTPPAEVEKVIEIATGFTIKNCKAWLPGVRDLFEPILPVPAPLPAWPPSGFTEVSSSPGFATRPAKTQLETCSTGSRCWDRDVVAKVPCEYGSFAKLQIFDASNAPVGFDFAFIQRTTDASPVRAHFETAILGKITGGVTMVTCF